MKLAGGIRAWKRALANTQVLNILPEELLLGDLIRLESNLTHVQAWKSSLVNRALRIQIQRDLREAEGYLELEMPRQALKALDRITHAGTYRGQSLFLRGTALRDLQRYEEALPHLTEAADYSPSNVHIWLTLAWCQKRTDRLNQAIDSLQQALEVEPSNGLLHYNLACYYSLAREKQLALAALARSLELDRNFLDLIPEENDFDPLRNDPQFQDLTTIIV